MTSKTVDVTSLKSNSSSKIIGKPFTIFGLTFYHEDSSFKIGTDALLFSAVIRGINDISSVLDVGCGCGIVGLSYIGKHRTSRLTGIDVHLPSVQRAAANAALNGLNDRSVFYQADFTRFPTDEKFDLIVSNPPYFQNHLKSMSEEKNLSRHLSGELTYDVLISKAAEVCGKFTSLILPWFYRDRVIRLAVAGRLHLCRAIDFWSKPSSKQPVRSVLVFSKVPGKMPVETERYFIRNEDNSYHSDYSKLIGA
ncbi:methyltransferase [Schleiferia thermophila]|uniref:methyltransferase n=1 Tax=Schleiferia thermophila TaxID=884107 RepID=UPI0004E7A0BB|nr:methyltransferase [Schleiferia thermophila]KFD39398.1 hypothetical protein AT05_05750 [Schleiferia thermophila str. Yellowstone]